MDRNQSARYFVALAIGLGVFAVDAVCVAEPAVSNAAVKEDLSQRTTVSIVDYKIPEIQLIRDNGKTVSLPKEINDGRAVVVNFIFTTCASICPLSSQTFAAFQEKLGSESGRVHLVSISIDPEQDTPERLRQYAKQFSAGPSWQHYTGTLDASLAAQRAFGVYRGDKMGHTPVTLMRAAPNKRWRRIDGFVTPDELLHEFHVALEEK